MQKIIEVKETVVFEIIVQGQTDLYTTVLNP